MMSLKVTVGAEPLAYAFPLITSFFTSVSNIVPDLMLCWPLALNVWELPSV